MRFATLLFLCVSGTALADEGMWTFDRFPSDQVKAKYGFGPDAAWLDKVRLASARLAHCSASFVSPGGLIMTNHHCARDCVEDVSTKEKDYVSAGFYAREQKDELRCPGEYVDQLLEIIDVTAKMNQATQGKSGDAFSAAQRAEQGAIEKACQVDAKTRCQVVSLYRGGFYHLYKYRRWDDVRLVFAPEEAAAFFGGDPDNYEFPRWNYDVSFLRAYEDGKPAATPVYFPWSKNGAKENEVVFFSGNPGSTSRLLTVAQLRFERDVKNPEWGRELAESRGFLGEFRHRGPEQARTALGKLFGIDNNYKRARGQFRMLTDPAFFAAREAAEKDLRAKVAADPAKQKRFGAAWDEIERALGEYLGYRVAHRFLEEGKGFDSQLFAAARTLYRGQGERKKPDAQRMREYQDATRPALEAKLFSTAPMYPELEIATLAFSLSKMREELRPDHPVVRRLLSKETPEELAARVVNGSKLADPEMRRRLWNDETALAAAMKTDPMLQLVAAIDPEARAVRQRYEAGYEAVTKKNGELIARARFEVYGTAMYPDATFTPRLAYGAIRGYEELGVKVPAMTTVAGLYTRATGRPPTELPKSWVAAKGKLSAALPFNFVCTPDSVGGNSGSPILNQKAEIVGLYFDQNAVGTATPLGYDETRRRGIGVHSQLLVEALRVVYGAERLVKEIRGR
jgi:Peptidase S46